MGRAYSTDLRERVIELRADGYTQQGIAQLLRMSLSTVKRYVVRYQATGSVAPTVAKRKESTFSEVERAMLTAQVETHPSWTLHEHAAGFAERSGRWVSHMSIHRVLRHLGFTYKKRQWVRVSAMSSNASYLPT